MTFDPSTSGVGYSSAEEADDHTLATTHTPEQRSEFPAVWDGENRAQDRADEALDAMRVHNGMTLDEFLGRR